MAQALTTDLGDVVYVAPERRKRPRGTQDGRCPFCAGNESMTPPTVQQRPANGAWRARAFSNRFPITEVHELVVDTPRHVLTSADIEPEEAVEALRLYRDRTASMHERGLHYVLFRNEGPGAGGSIPHTHAQIVGEADPFPRQRTRTRTPEDLPILERRGLRLSVPAVARFPFEAWVLGEAGSPAFHELEDGTIDALAPLLLAASGGMRDLTKERGWNVVLHVDDAGWRFEFLPRTETLAGLELGGDVWVNAVEAEESLEWWRGRLAT